MRQLYVAMLVGIALLASQEAAVGRHQPHAKPGLSQMLSKGQAALKAHDYRRAIETCSRPVQDPSFVKDPAAPALLMTLAEASEAYVHGINARYWKRSRLNPRSPSWLGYLRQEQRWAERHYASFEYYEPRSRYRYEGDAYKLLIERFPKHALAEEAAWRLIPQEDDGEHNLDVNPALVDASRHERFLKQFPRSKYRLAAKLAIGWDYLYASGITWGSPNQHRFQKGEHILKGIIREAPQSPEAHKAQLLLAKAKNPFGYQAPKGAR